MTDDELTPRDRAGRVSRAVSLLDLRLVEVHGELLDGQNHDNYLVELQVDLTPELDAEVLTYGVTFRLVLRPTGADATAAGNGDEDSDSAVEEDAAPSYTATGTFQLLYDVTGSIDDGDLQAFGEISAMYSAWPYARELFTTLTARSGLTPLVLRSFLAPAVGS